MNRPVKTKDDIIEGARVVFQFQKGAEFGIDVAGSILAEVGNLVG